MSSKVLGAWWSWPPSTRWKPPKVIFIALMGIQNLSLATRSETRLKACSRTNGSPTSSENQTAYPQTATPRFYQLGYLDLLYIGVIAHAQFLTRFSSGCCELSILNTWMVGSVQHLTSNSAIIGLFAWVRMRSREQLKDATARFATMKRP